MPVFPKPTVAYSYNPQTEIAHLRAHKTARGIPAKSAKELLAGALFPVWSVGLGPIQQKIERAEIALRTVATY